MVFQANCPKFFRSRFAACLAIEGRRVKCLHGASDLFLEAVILGYDASLSG